MSQTCTHLEGHKHIYEECQDINKHVLHKIVTWQYFSMDLHMHLVAQGVSEIIWQFEHIKYVNIHCYNSPTQSAEPLEGLKNTAVEQPCLPTDLLSNQNPPVRTRSVDEDDFTLKQTEF